MKLKKICSSYYISIHIISIQFHINSATASEGLTKWLEKNWIIFTANILKLLSDKEINQRKSCNFWAYLVEKKFKETITAEAYVQGWRLLLMWIFQFAPAETAINFVFSGYSWNILAGLLDLALAWCEE